MGSSLNLLGIGSIAKKSDNFSMHKSKTIRTKQDFEKILLNQKPNNSNQDIEQKVNSPQKEIIKKLENIGKQIVSNFRNNEIDDSEFKVQGLDEDETALIEQLTQLADLINQLNQKLQLFSSNNTAEVKVDSIENELGLSNNMTDINNLLSDLNEMGNKFPLIQKLLAELILDTNNELLKPQLLLGNDLADVKLVSDKPTNPIQPSQPSEVTEVTKVKNETTVPQDFNLKLIDDKNGELEKVLSKLIGSFKDLINTANNFTDKNNYDLNVREMISNLEGIISTVQPKLVLLEKIPLIVPIINDKEKQINVKNNLDSISEIMTEDLTNEENIEISSKNNNKTISDDISKKVENQENANNQNEFGRLKANKSPDKLNNIPDSNVVTGKESNPQFTVLNDNQLVNKQQLNMQEVQNIFKAQLVNVKESGGNVLNQIVQKATLMVKEGFSEMKMQLKPDALGKIDLQISVERGIVTAKFAAESQQVKELIEANLTNLKQNLSNQGLKIDQISVAVGNQQNLNDHSKRPNHQASNKNNKKYKLEDGESYGVILSNELEGITKQWYSESTVDYTA